MLNSTVLSQVRNMSKIGPIHLIKPTGATHTGTVIFFHGSGDTGGNMKEWVDIMSRNKFSFPHIKVIFPTAPLQPYTPAGGNMSNVWFDRAGISPQFPEKLDSLSEIQNEVKELLRKENEAGIPNNRIIIGGFSMGGALSLHALYRWNRDVAGGFAFSSFLNDNSIVYEELKAADLNTILPPLLQLHGDSDEMVDMKWGQDTFTKLKSLRVQGEFHVLQKLGHSIDQKGMRIVKDWVDKVLPPV